MRKSTRITSKKQSRRRRYKTKCRRNTRRCAVQRRTRKQYGASGKRSIGEAVDEMRQRLRQQDSSWYNANVVPAEERSAKRRAEIDAMNRPEAFTAPSIASMGDPEMMRKHIETLDRAEERDNQLLKLALERSIARADAEQQREEEKYSLKNLYPITGGPKPLFHYAGHIMSDEKVPAGSKFKNLFTNDDTQPQKKRRR
jgi:hypothetical protein